MFYLYTFIYSKVVWNLSFLLLNINAILKKVENQTVAGPQCSLRSVNVDQQLFGFPHSSKYLLTDVNVCGAEQNIDAAATELQLIECVLYQDTMIFLQKQIVETFLSGPVLAKCALSRILLLCPLPQILWK